MGNSRVLLIINIIQEVIGNKSCVLLCVHNRSSHISEMESPHSTIVSPVPVSCYATAIGMSPSIAFHCKSKLNISTQIACYFSQLCFLLLHIYLIIKAKVFIYPSKFTGPSLCHMWVVGLYKEEGVTKAFLVTH